MKGEKVSESKPEQDAAAVLKRLASVDPATLTREQILFDGLRAWKVNLEESLASEVGDYEWMHFRPPRATRAAIERMQAKVPQLVEQAFAALRWCEDRFAEFERAEPNAANNVYSAIESLYARVAALVDFVSVEPTIKRLSPGEKLILRKMLELGARAGHYVGAEKIVWEAYEGFAYKHALKKLKKDLQLVESKPGKGSGYTLTDEGIRVAQVLQILI